MTAAVNAGAYLHHLALQTQNPAGMAQFYADTMNMEARQDGSTWICEGPLRRMIFVPGESRRLDYAGFACRDAEGLDGIRQQIRRQEIELIASPSPYFGREAFALRDTDGNVVVFGLAAQEPPRHGIRGPLQHLTLASETPDRIEAFYVNKLGFRTSDYARAEDGRTLAVWTRSNHEHHTLACFRRGYQGIDHFSFEAGDWNVIKDWCDRMGERRIPIVWGPGRHGPGNNIFIFIEDPDRNWIEISAEMEVIYNRPSKVWKSEDYTLNMWGRAIHRD
jgi:catechol 2,3-dioxygenase-like lactoylglutathione lyase family enzyme